MKKYIFTLISLFLFHFANADDVNITTSAPKKVGVGQQFEVKYSIVNKNGSSPRLSNNTNFNVLSGPNQGSSTNMSIVNNTVSQSITYTFSYYFTAKNTGTFNLPVFSINIDNQTYSSKPTSIEIQKDPVQNNNNRNNPFGYDPWADMDNFFNQPQQTQQTQQINDEDIFLRIFLSKSDLYKGEAVVVTVKLFCSTNISLYGLEDIKFPALNSFYSQEIYRIKELKFKRETYNNKAYNTSDLVQYVLYPRVSGDLTIEKSRTVCQVLQGTGGFWGRTAVVKKEVFSPEVKVNVKPLPQTQNYNFNGAVGNFNIKFDANTKTANVNDAISVKLSLSGTGNFNALEVPKISFPKEFEVFEPVITDNTSATAEGIKGTKTWEYTIIPRYPGDFELKKNDFTFFDINTKQYQTTSTSPIKLNIEKSQNTSPSNNNHYSYSRKNIEYIDNEDIKFIKNGNLNLKKNYKPIISGYLFSLFYIIPVISFVLLIIVLRKTIKENSDLSKQKAKKANKVSKKRLKKAGKYLKENQKTEFYKEIISALWGYVSDKLSIPVAELSKSNVETMLEKRNVNRENINEFISIIDKCEYAHFAPASAEMELNHIYVEATKIIECLEEKIK